MANYSPKTLIDMHCHVFNAADLPAVPFIYRVVADRFSANPDALIVRLAAMVTALAGGIASSARPSCRPVQHHAGPACCQFLW